MFRASEADGFVFADDTIYELLVAKHVGCYSTRLLLQWQVIELIYTSARYYKTQRGSDV